nr:LytS/YhcK type 5TM receptor domain-containing protein [uncultured Desulfobacter sp.]
MTISTFIGLINNAALLVSLVLIYDIVVFRQTEEKAPSKQIPIGLILGLIGLAIMKNPWEFLPGIIFDTRSILLSLCGLFFGTVPTVAAIIMTGGFRLYLGGAGAWTGFAVIVTSGAVGLGWRHFMTTDLDSISSKSLYLMGCVTHGLMLLSMLTLPRAVVLGVLSKISLPVMLIFPAGTVLLGSLLINRRKRIKSEQLLKENEQRYKSAQRMGQVGNWEYDIVTELFWGSEQAKRIFGFDPDSNTFSIEKVESCIPERKRVHQALIDLIEKDIPYDLEFEIHPVSGPENRIIRSIAELSRNDSEAPLKVFGVIQDVTDEKKAQLERKKLETALNQAQKMESIGRLAGGVAHDFNNMLSIILGNTEIIQGNVDQDDPIINNLKEIKKAGERSSNLTRQLLAFARKQTIEPKVLDLNDAIEGMLKMLRRLIGENIELSWSPKINLLPVKIDPSQIDQILANLCVNARDAIKDVGKVIIETESFSIDENYCIDHPSFKPGDYVVLTVSDTGYGMSSEIRKNIFEPFFTTKSLGKGTGLGLATVYGIVKQNNGFIDVYSEPMHGTSVKIYLPKSADSIPERLNQNILKDIPKGSETILMVEDEKAILEMTSMMMERQGYTVLKASNPADAIDIVNSFKSDIDLLITDVIMPGMNGRDLANELQSRFKNLKCLFISGYTADVIAHHGVLDDGMQFLQKPFSMEALVEKIRGIIHE